MHLSKFYKSIKKIILTLLILLFFGTMYTVEAAKRFSLQNLKVTISCTDLPITSVFEELSKQSGLLFFYNNEVVEGIDHVTLNYRNESIKKVLAELAEQTNLSFRQIDSTISVSRRILPSESVETEPKTVQHPIISGKVTDDAGEPMPGVNVVIKGTGRGVISDVDGNFSIAVDSKNVTLVFSFVGYTTREIEVGDHTLINVTMVEDLKELEEVVVVGYGTQKKLSTVGAIVQTTAEELQRTGGMSNLSQALQGQLAGVAVVQISGEPGAEELNIFVRGQGTWNSSQPLILVDGIERKMTDIDISEVESVSVLKDGSATAVYGVKGSEGVILVTTKRGQIGKPVISADFNVSTKQISRLPDKLNSYDQYIYLNKVLEYELNSGKDVWSKYVPYEMLQYYKQPQANGLQYIFPDVDWVDEMVKPFPLSYRGNVNVSGGTEFAKYFGSIGYTFEDDILRTGTDPMNSGYKAANDYSRINFRTNLDLSITKTTTFSVNLAGYVGTKRNEFGSGTVSGQIFKAFAEAAPDEFAKIMPGEGVYGYNPYSSISNPYRSANNRGLGHTRTTNVTTDFILKQDLDFITKGLSLRGSFSYDNIYETSGGIQDNGTVYNLYIDPTIIDILEPDINGNYIDANGNFNLKEGKTEKDLLNYMQGYVQNQNANSDYDALPGSLSYNAEDTSSDNRKNTLRRLFYQIQLNYTRTFGVHDITAMAVVNREQYAKGNMFPRYREDWAGRITYGYDNRYLFEANFAYNGSEQFAPGKRFGFFPSAAVGWVLSNEKFMQDIEWLYKVKFRYSIGKVGNDNTGAERWSYMNGWSVDRTSSDLTYFGFPQRSASTYIQYIEDVLGNPNLTWETSLKQNLGIELGFFKNKLALNMDLFLDKRSGIYMSASQRTIAPYFGQNAVAANIGETEVKGYELEVIYRNSIGKDFNYNLTFNHTGNFDKVIYMEDAPMLPAYQKAEGYRIGQRTNQLQDGVLQNWDDVYSSVKYESSNSRKLPGDYRINDFNGDGIINTDDNAPYSYPLGRPLHTYGWTVGADYKGFNFMIQFYGVYNVLREYTGYIRWPFRNSGRTGPVYDGLHTESWFPDNSGATLRAMRSDMETEPGQATLAYEDGSYLRLKTAEIGYTFNKGFIKRFGATSLRIYLNGNNLFFWSKVIEDREGRGSQTVNSVYPITRRFNLGFNVKF